MNVLPAMKDTLDIAIKSHVPVDGPLGRLHLADMYVRAHGASMSYGKLCRWLGWMQCAVVAAGAATLEDMKRINKLFSNDGPTWRHLKRGSTYEVETQDALLQCSSAQEFEDYFEGKTFTIYRCPDTGKTFLRPTKEFLDGRFEKVSE